MGGRVPARGGDARPGALVWEPREFVVVVNAMIAGGTMRGLEEGLRRLRGAVMEAATGTILALPETYNTRGGVSKAREEVGPAWTRR